MQEDEKTEFKISLDEDAIAKTMTAFANGNGGKIYIGMTDEGKALGAAIGKHKLEQFTRKIHDEIAPPIVFETRFEKSGDGELLVIHVHPAKRKPVFFNGTAYKRVNKTTLKVTDPEELRSLFLNKTVFFDDIPCPSARISDIEGNSIRKFVSMATLAGRLVRPSVKDEEILSKLGVMDGKELKNGALMIFGKNPSSFFPVWGIRCAVVSSSLEFTSMQDFDGNLINSIEEAMEFILARVPKDIRMESLRRIETPRIPPEAIREALVNAVVHRDYLFPSYTYITIGPDFIEIKNPGRLEGLSLEDLAKTHSSVIKNPHVAQALYLSGYIEKWGSGTLKIYNTMRQQGLKDPRFNSDSMFSVRLEMQAQKLNERQKFILSVLKDDKPLKPGAVAKRFKVSVTTAVNDFSHLVRLGLISREGNRVSSVFKLIK